MAGIDFLEAGGPSAKAHWQGLLSWWALAGVDCAVAEAPVNWLKPKPSASVPRAAGPATSAFPDALDAFHDWLANASDLPEAGWPGPRIMPAGPSGPRLMIVLHAPDSSAMQPGCALAPEGMALLKRMMQAIGLDLSDCYVASLSLVAPAGGMLDGAAAEALTARMRHHIGLVAPQALLLLGDQVNRALCPTDGLDPSRNLLFVNHSDGIVPAGAIAHPRLLLGQPLAKAGAWRILRELVKGWGQ